MGVAFDNATSAQGNPLTSQSFALPTIAAGETIGLLVAWNTNGAVTISGAGSWSHQGTDGLIAAQIQVALYTAFSATGSESGQNVTINVAAQEKFAAIAFSYGGVNSTTPLLSGPTYATFTTSNNTSATSPSVSPSPSSWVLTGYASKSSTNASYTTPSGLTLRQSVFGSGGGAIDLSLFDTNGNVSSGGGQTSTMGTATSNKIAFTIVLNGVSSTAAGTLTFSGTAAASYPAAGTLSFGGTPSAKAPASAAGTLSFSGTPAVTIQAGGQLAFGGTATAANPAVGQLSLSGTATPKATASSPGQLTFGGAPAVTYTAAGQLTFTGTGTPKAAPTAAGTLSFSGSSTAKAVASSVAGIVFTGTPVATTRTSGAGQLSLTGLATPKAVITAAGQIVFTGTGNVSPVALGQLVFSGTAVRFIPDPRPPFGLGQAVLVGGTHRCVLVASGASTATGTSGSAAVLAVSGSGAVILAPGSTSATLAGTGKSSVAIPTNGSGKAVVQ